MVNVSANGTATGPNGAVGWSINLPLEDGSGNGDYGNMVQLIENHPEEFVDLLKQFAEDKLGSDWGVTSFTWTSEQVARPSIDILHEEP